MPRSSRHKSHRYHKHSSRDATERSDSEDDGSSRDRRQRVEEGRVSRDVESEKRKASTSLHASLEKDKDGSENGDLSSEHGRKRKERGEGAATPDRWNVSGKEDGLAEKGSKEEGFGPFDIERPEKSRVLTVESKSRSSGRREGSLERYVESSSRTESAKRRSEKEHSRRDYRVDRERDMEQVSEREKDRERGLERDKKVQESRHGRSDDVESRSQSSRRGGAEEDRTTKKDSTDLEKDPEKCMTKRRSSSGGIDKWQDDGRNSDDKRLSSRDAHIKNGIHKVEGHKDERHKDDRYRDKYYKDLDRDQRHRDIRHREERSRDYTGDRVESKSSRDRDKAFDSYSKKSKLHGSDREVSPQPDDHGIKSRDNRSRKRSYDQNDDHYGLKHSSKGTRSDVEKDASNLSKLEYRHQFKVDSSLANNLLKSSPSSKNRSLKDENRRGLKQAEYAHREAVLDERARPSEDHEKFSESLSSEKIKHRDRISSDDRERQLENQNMGNHFQADLQNSEHVSVTLSPFKRTGHLPAGNSSPGHIFPQPPMRHGMDSSSIYEDENRTISGDRRSSSRFKRSSDPNVDRGQGVVWKNGPTWPAPVPNGFIPFQNGPPAPGFHSAIQHFPPPSLFGARPYMEMNQTGIPFHMHEIADRFSGHGHPFGWHHPLDDSGPSQMQGWDGSNSHFVDKSQAYGRPDWDHNRHLRGGRGWDLNGEIWKGHNANMANVVESSSPQEIADESRDAYANLQFKSEVDHFQHASDDNTRVKHYNDPPDNKSIETSVALELKSKSLPCKRINDDSQNLCNYFSKIEISADLLHPELYNNIMNLLKADNSTSIYNDSKDKDVKNNKVQILAKPSDLNSLLPRDAHAAFQRAMSVYEKQNYGRKVKPPASAVCSKENISPEVTDANEMIGASSFVPPELLIENTNSIDDIEMVGTDKVAASPTEEEDIKSSPLGGVESSPAHMEVEHVGDSPGGNTKEQSEINSDVVLMESSQVCEVIMQDCKVNLSRIHNPPESTH